MNLVIDQGNTICKVAVYDAETLVISALCTRFTESTLRELLERYPSIGYAIYSSVGPYDQEAVTMLRRYLANVLELGASVPVPMQVGYDRSTLGSDRLAAAVAAYRLAGSGVESLVIDAGTAITYERVTGDGCYIGGNIAPGLYIRLRAMHEFTSRLPLLDESQYAMSFGVDTKSAMGAGALVGLIYEMRGYVDSLRQECAGAKVYLTGGDADLLACHLDRTIQVVPDLVPLGLNYILEYNK